MLREDRCKRDDRQNTVVINEEGDEEARDGGVFLLHEQSTERAARLRDARAEDGTRTVRLSGRFTDDQEERKREEEKESRGDDEREPYEEQVPGIRLFRQEDLDDQKDRERAKIIGVHNGLLAFGFKQHDFSPAGWRENHEILTSDEFAKGYVFHRDYRNCPVAIIPVGATPDTSWSDEPFSSTGTPAVAALETALKDALRLSSDLSFEGLKRPDDARAASKIAERVEAALTALGWRP